ncbi:MAG: hypothetical protein A3B37_02145 [Candidatus Sungbacteria bacterium RIFCSPLOWO2_01_FULL_59_16]|uniref:Uncharacterized protein n=1 Tax=Candidatus Sungbacteria bacterium RIFCSPLOWO2_01_FULL_59_16 TaxID=1802280 RepID=A0A1G2LF71_9BACT|nr:MAG: hypothetical protein A3B37_02145 [Candidatus Sungbacteria bacterium RIFCSPLOWO2_01_FULL_59_16]
MDIGAKFFLIFAGTIAATRALLFIRPIPSPVIRGFRIHHYMYGLAGLFISLPAGLLPLYAISIGLFADELTFVLMGGQLHKEDYQTKTSLAGTACVIALAFLLKNYLAAPFSG